VLYILSLLLTTTLKKVWVFVLKSKNQVIGAFRKFHANVEREKGRKLKYVRANNGGEYKGLFY